jgi:hypothetical protein
VLASKLCGKTIRRGTYCSACAKEVSRETMIGTLCSYFVGVSTGAPLSFTRNTMNFAGLVLLAFRPTM